MGPVVFSTAMKTTRCALLVGVLMLTASSGQTQTARQFEVASVRPTPPSDQHGLSLGFRMDAAGMHIGSLTLREIVAAAYRVKTYQVRGPDWTETERFDVNATLPPGAKADQIPEMLQALLAERFGLTLHREKKEMPVYALIVGKPPLRVKELAPEPHVVTSADVINGTLSGGPAGVYRDFGNGSSYSFVGGKFEGRKLSVATLATELERYADRPIVDVTELPGIYDATFQVVPEEYQVLLRRAAVNSGMVMPAQMMRVIDNDTNPLPQAIEQLGLKLDARRIPVDLLVIDQVRRTPVEN
jgi:uncharacterized protein (TIGR03435 family)